MELLSGIGLVAAAIGSIVGIMEGCKKFCQHVVIPIKQHFEMVHQSFASIEALKADLASLKKKIDYELNPNGGGSLKDEFKASSRSVVRLEGLILAVLNCSEQFILIFDEKGNALWANSAFERKLGWNEPDLIGFGWKNAIESSDRDQVCREFLNTVKDGRDFIMEFNYVHKNDFSKNYRVKAHCHPIKKSNGEIIAFLSLAVDITLK